jgi:uncharacterized protein YlaI
LGFVSRLVGERGSDPEPPDVTDGGDEGDQRGDGDQRDGRSPIRLYECPDCESVYLSTDLSTCESCDAPVDQIPSERDLGYGSTRRR